MATTGALGALVAALGTAVPAAAQDGGAAAELAEVEAALDALGERVQRLRDVSDISKLQRSYGYYVDKAQWHDVRDLFAENGTLEIGGRGVFIGQERVFEYLETGMGPVGPTEGQLIDHQQFQGIVTIGPDGETAEGRWSAFVMGVTGWGDATYENDYVKEDGVWKIRTLHAPFNMFTSYAEGWAWNNVPNTRPESFPPPPDLPPTVVYLTYPNYYNEPFHYSNPVTGRDAPPPDPAAGGTAFGEPAAQ